MKFALKSQWKTILIILLLVIIQTYFQIEIINLFSIALKNLESQKVNLLYENGTLMLIYTIFSMISIFTISFLSINVSSKIAYNTRKKIFHILMNLPDEELNKFKITALITRSTRGVFSEQGFIILLLEHFLIIPFVFIAVIIKIAFIDKTFAGLFAIFIIILFVILIFRLKQITNFYFKVRKTYGKLNTLFLSKINNLVNNTPFKKQESKDEFKKTCGDSYEKNIKYRLSQYYLGPVLLLVLSIVILILLTMMSFKYNIGFEGESAIDSVVIIQYMLYFLTTLLVIPKIIEIWPRAYVISIRLEEVLNIEDKIIKTKNKNNNSKIIEIIKEDINNDYENLLVDRREVIQKFKEVLNQHSVKVIISMILLTISTLCIVYAPKVAGNIINLIVLNSNSSNNQIIFHNLALLFALYSVGYLFKLPSSRFMVFVGEKIAYDLRIELFDKLDIIDSKFIQSNSKGTILSRLNNDLVNVKEFIILHISEICAQFLSILCVIVLSLITEWRLGLIYLITLPIYVFCFYYSDLKSIKSYDNHQKNLGQMMSYFERSLENRNNSHEKGFEKINKTVINNYVKSRSISSVILPITNFLTNLSNITVYIFGVYFLITNEIQLGTLLTVIIYGQLLTKPLKKVSTGIISLENSFSSIKRIFAIINFKNKE